MRAGLLGIALIALVTVTAEDAIAQIEFEPVISGFNSPIFVTAPPGDERLFVLEQDGLIRLVENGTILPTPFLDLTAETNQVGERGLLGMAFHPDYDSNGLFYVHYSAAADGATTLVEYQVSGDPNVADAGSATILLTEPQPFSNHNGGMLAFKPGEAGNYLYMALGDGGDAGDPFGNAQNINTILGTILRLDVDNGGMPPASNPFVGVAGDDRIWLYGLRNPWRFSFDSATGDMYIGDVGQNNFEEIDFIPASSTGGENLGWDLLEGTNDFECVDCDQARMDTLLPIHEYSHSDGISVTGGYVYRGSAIPSLQGTYFFGDYSGRIWSFRFDGATITEFQEWTLPIGPSELVVSFGEDGFGELYFVLYSGAIYRLVDNTPFEVTSRTGGGLHEEGETVTLSVGISGTVGMTTYEWFKNGSGTALSNGGNVSGATTPNLTFSPVTIADSGSYVLEVTDEAKALYTVPAIALQVLPPGSLPAMGMLGLGLGLGILMAIGLWRIRGRDRAQNRRER